MSVFYIFLALFSFLTAGLFGRFFGRSLTCFLPLFYIFLVFQFSLFYSFELFLSSDKIMVYSITWLNFIDILFNFGFLFDSLTCVMIIIITCISFFVHAFSIDYMSHDPHISRFMSYLSLFTFFMLILVTANNFLQLFIGWEGVGLCSYLLINFWSTRIAANQAALQAMIVNRVADVFFVLGIFLLIIYTKTISFNVIFDSINYLDTTYYFVLFFDVKLIDLISFFIFIGSIGKSAQLLFHTWLPDAMEGPTPVSSLLHAATMVTAGVFLIIRCSLLFNYSSIMLMFIFLIGSITALFSGLIGYFQYDLKKVIAYSTCSQLGYMFFSCGLSNYQVAIFHLFNHAFFKALLFLSAGAVIHMLFDEQDIRRMGRLINYINFPFFTLFLGSITIAGFPFLTGFYSKDLLIETIYSMYLFDTLFIYYLAIITAFLTAAYSFRLISFTFLFFINGFFIVYYYVGLYLLNHIEVMFFMLFSMVSLSFLTIVVGYIFSDLFVGFGSFLWYDLFYIKFINYTNVEVLADLLSHKIKNIPLIISTFGFIFSLLVIYVHIVNNMYTFYYTYFISAWYNISSLIVDGFNIKKAYDNIFIFSYINSYVFFMKNLDKGFFEYIGPYGFFRFFQYLSFKAIYSDPYFFFANIGRTLVYLLLFLFVLFYIQIDILFILFMIFFVKLI